MQAVEVVVRLNEQRAGTTYPLQYQSGGLAKVGQDADAAVGRPNMKPDRICLLYTSDAADE